MRSVLALLLSSMGVSVVVQSAEFVFSKVFLRGRVSVERLWVEGDVTRLCQIWRGWWEWGCGGRCGSPPSRGGVEEEGAWGLGAAWEEKNCSPSPRQEIVEEI